MPANLPAAAKAGGTKAGKKAGKKADAGANQQPGKDAGQAAAKRLLPWQQWRAGEGAIDDLCARIEAGESQSEISRSFGIDEKALRYWIATDDTRRARVRAARAASAQTWDERAERLLEESSDPFELSRAKELAHHYRWRASKMSPDYADRVKVGGDEAMAPVRHEVSAEVTVAPSEAYLRMLGGK